MKKLLFIVALGALFTYDNGLAQTPRQECATSLLSLIKKNDIPQVQAKLKDCMKHGSTDEQFKSVRELTKDKSEIEQIGRIQQEINEKNRADNPPVESNSITRGLMWIWGGVLGVAAAVGLYTEYRAMKDEYKDIEREEEKQKKKQKQKS